MSHVTRLLPALTTIPPSIRAAAASASCQPLLRVTGWKLPHDTWRHLLAWGEGEDCLWSGRMVCTKTILRAPAHLAIGLPGLEITWWVKLEVDEYTFRYPGCRKRVGLSIHWECNAYMRHVCLYSLLCPTPATSKSRPFTNHPSPIQYMYCFIESTLSIVECWGIVAWGSWGVWQNVLPTAQHMCSLPESGVVDMGAACSGEWEWLAAMGRRVQRKSEAPRAVTVDDDSVHRRMCCVPERDSGVTAFKGLMAQLELFFIFGVPLFLKIAIKHFIFQNSSGKKDD